MFGAPMLGGDVVPCQGYIPFLLFLVIEIVVVCVIGMACTKKIPVAANESRRSLRQAKSTLQKIIVGVLLLAILAAAASVVEKQDATITREGKLGFMGGVQGVFLLILLFAATRSDPTEDARGMERQLSNPLVAPLLGAQSVNSEPVEYKQQQRNSYTLGEAAVSVRFWLIFVSSLIGGGSGVLVITNLGQITDAVVGTENSDVTVFVTLFSVCNCAGRLFSGVMGDHLLTKGYPRPLVFSFNMVLMAIAHVLLMTGNPDLLYVACVLAGASYGAFNALCPTLISEIFGLKYFGSIYAANSISNGAASLGMATVMAGKLYQRHAVRNSEGVWTCHGTHCYFESFLICAVACGVGATFGLVLTGLTKKRYTLLYQDLRTKLSKHY